jgi:hypothetical protein
LRQYFEKLRQTPDYDEVEAMIVAMEAEAIVLHQDSMPNGAGGLGTRRNRYGCSHLNVEPRSPLWKDREA